MRIAIVGSKGQLGSALCRCFGSDAIPLTRDRLDLTDATNTVGTLQEIDPDLVINAAAYNRVDKAEEEPQLAFSVNALGPRLLADYCGRNEKTLIHIGTDYVFGLDSERTEPYRETDAPGPQSVYAASKLAGEHFVRSLCRKHYVIRTCGLYGKLADDTKKNFVETMIELSDEREEISVVNDQHCTPTYVENLVAVIERLIETEIFGLYHATNSGRTTWYELATHLFHVLGKTVKVTPTSTAQFGAPAKRPSFSVLDCGKLKRETGMTLSSWQTAVEEYLTVRET